MPTSTTTKVLSCLIVCLILLVALIGILFINMNIVTSRSVREQMYFDEWSAGNSRALLNSETLKYLPELSLSMLQRFRAGIQYATVSYDPHSVNNSVMQPFEGIIQHIVKSYPRVHSHTANPLIHWERVNQHSLLYIIHGTDSKLKPALLLAHLDVVPVGDQTWSVEPFSAILKRKDGSEIEEHDSLKEKDSTFVYGRGTIDDKQSIFGLLEALEYILSKKEELHFRPARTIILAFGHDEEVGGLNGAAHIRRRLEVLGYKELEYLLDEGTMVLDNALQYLKQPLALVSVAEKGFANVRLDLRLRVDPQSKAASHSSMPVSEGSVIILLSKALLRLQENPLPSRFHSKQDVHSGLVKLLEMTSPYVPLWVRLFTTNMWLFGPLLSNQLNKFEPALDAMTRTTNAFTIVQGGHKTNVLPNEATAYINHRIHPADSLETLRNHYQYLLGDKSWIPTRFHNSVDVKWEFLQAKEPSHNSITSNEAFGLLYAATKYIYPDALLSPATLVANTDSYHYLNMTQHVYRFCPTRLEKLDLKRFHGVDERILLSSYEKLVHFYYLLLTNSDSNLSKSSEKHPVNDRKIDL